MIVVNEAGSELPKKHVHRASARPIEGGWGGIVEVEDGESSITRPEERGTRCKNEGEDGEESATRALETEGTKGKEEGRTNKTTSFPVNRR